MEPSPKRTCLDLETPSTPSSLSNTSEASEEHVDPHFTHFKIQFDPAWDYAKICKDFFMHTHPYLAILEDVAQNPHVHFQGTTMYSDTTVKHKITGLVKKHYKRKYNPKCRPSSMSCRAPDVMGFQYMCKQVKEELILVKNMFTLDDIKEMKEHSTLYVKALKTNVTDFIKNLDAKTLLKDILLGETKHFNTEHVLKNVNIHMFQMHRKGELDLPPYNKHHTRNSIIRGLIDNPHTPLNLQATLYAL